MSKATGPSAGLVESTEGYAPISMNTMHMPIVVNRRLHSPYVSSRVRRQVQPSTNSAYNSIEISEATGLSTGLVESTEGYASISMDTMHMPIAVNRRLHPPYVSSSVRRNLVQRVHTIGL